MDDLCDTYVKHDAQYDTQVTFTVTIKNAPQNRFVKILDEQVAKRRYVVEQRQQNEENQRYKKRVMPNNYVKPANIVACQIPWTNVVEPVVLPFTKGTMGNCLMLETNFTNIGRYQNSGKSHPLCFDFQNVMYSNQDNMSFNWLDTLDFSIFMLESSGIKISNFIFVLGGKQDNVEDFRYEIMKREYNRPFIVIDAKTTNNERNNDDNVVYSIGVIHDGIIVSNDYMSKNEDLLCQARNARTGIEKNVIKESMKNYFGNSHVMNKSQDCDLRMTDEGGYMSLTFPKDLFFVYNK